MLAELLGKGGCLCQPAKDGKIRCPLMIRPSSEDVVTANLFQVLGAINPRFWLPQVLNLALGAPRFRQQVFRGFRLQLWKNMRAYPRELLPWDEGSTQVDAVLTWDNPPTTIFFEMKLGSKLSERTTCNDGKMGFPSDQLIRNVRVGLMACGYFQHRRLFHTPVRDFAVIVVAPKREHALVNRYRDMNQLKRAIPHSDRLQQLPRVPFVGELGYRDICGVLNSSSRSFSWQERRLSQQLIDYLQFKAVNHTSIERGNQNKLGFEEER